MCQLGYYNRKLRIIFPVFFSFLCIHKHGRHQHSSVDATGGGIVQWWQPVVNMNGRRFQKMTLPFIDRMVTRQHINVEQKYLEHFDRELFSMLKEEWLLQFGMGPEYMQKETLLQSQHRHLMAADESKLLKFRGRNGKRFAMLSTGDKLVHKILSIGKRGKKFDSVRDVAKLVDRSYEWAWSLRRNPHEEMIPHDYLLTDYKNIYGMNVGLERNIYTDFREGNRSGWKTLRKAPPGTEIFKSKGNLQTTGWEDHELHDRLAPIYGQKERMAVRDTNGVVQDVSQVYDVYSNLHINPNPVSSTWEGLAGSQKARKKYHRGKRSRGVNPTQRVRKVGRDNEEEIQRLKPGVNVRSQQEVLMDLVERGEVHFDSNSKAQKFFNAMRQDVPKQKPRKSREEEEQLMAKTRISSRGRTQAPMQRRSSITGRTPLLPSVPSMLPSRRFKWNRTPSGKWRKTS